MAEKKKVLVISGTNAGRMYLGTILSRFSYEPILAQTAGQGIHLARQHEPGLVIYDIDPPTEEVRSILAVLQQAAATKNLPLVATTRDDRPEDAADLLSMGFVLVLPKPIDVFQAHKALGQLIGEPRSCPRVPVRIPVEIEEGMPKTTLTCTTLSEQGMFLLTHERVAEKAVLRVSFFLPEEGEQVRSAAEVVSAVSLGVRMPADPGIGLRFVVLPETSREKIRRFVQRQLADEVIPESESERSEQ